MSEATRPGDIFRSRWRMLLLYGLPGVAMVGSSFIAMSRPVVTLIWAVGLAIWGVVCVGNALRCNRVHCWFTGPFFLIMALAILLEGFGIVSLGGLSLLANVAVFGSLALWIVTESVFGKYFATRDHG